MAIVKEGMEISLIFGIMVNFFVIIIIVGWGWLIFKGFYF